MVADSGDSGGPVYSFFATNEVFAEGLTSGSRAGVDPDTDTLIYQPIGTALRESDTVLLIDQD
ncbi:hypothetical protein ACFQ1L_34925 [Phytohabitans flavus]|uniref:hypothetical protein n=1 Tax=Phytohabitans flavus TaxID=1076124 RepID=UPI00364339F6